MPTRGCATSTSCADSGLDLLVDVESALGRGHRVLVFDDVFRRILDDADSTELRAPREHLRQLEKADRAIRQIPRHERHDVRDATIVDLGETGAPETPALWVWVEDLIRRGELDAGAFGERPEDGPSWSPGPVAVGLDALVALARADAVESAICGTTAVGGRFAVTEDCAEALSRSIEHARDLIATADDANTLRRWVTDQSQRSRLLRIPRPSPLTRLFGARAQTDELLRYIDLPLSYRTAVIDDITRVHICADAL